MPPSPDRFGGVGKSEARVGLWLSGMLHHSTRLWLIVLKPRIRTSLIWALVPKTAERKERLGKFDIGNVLFAVGDITTLSKRNSNSDNILKRGNPRPI
jgi:hypothetical protein